MANAFTKRALISEIASRTNQTQKSAEQMLNALSEIAYREARNGFSIPGICKLKVVHKASSTCRNPATGQLIQVGERDILKVVPLKKAKDAITPRPEGLVQVLKEPQPTNTDIPEERAPLPPPQTLQDDTGQIVFSCPECGGMIGAPIADAGREATCPFCNHELTIPMQGEQGTAPREQSATSSTDGTLTDFITFVCATCNQEVEAPVEIIGMDVACPACSSSLTVPAKSFIAPTPVPEKHEAAVDTGPLVDRCSMTLRIDVSDLE